MSMPCVECSGILRFETLDRLEHHLKMFHGFLGEARIRAALAAAEMPVAEGKESTMTTHATVATPKACKVCARMAPDQCKRHGGPSHSTSFKGKASLALRKGGRPPKSRAQGPPPHAAACSRCHRKDGSHTPLCPRSGASTSERLPSASALLAAVRKLRREIEVRQRTLLAAQKLLGVS